MENRNKRLERAVLLGKCRGCGNWFHFQESFPSGRRRMGNRECAGCFGSGDRTMRSSIGMCIALEKKRVYRWLHLFQLLWLTIGHVELEVHVAWTM